MRPYLLIAALGGALALWWLARTEKGQAIASDAMDEVVVTAQRIGEAFIPKGIRNNNPGNIRWIEAPAARWRGMIAKDDSGLGIFDTAANGVRAIGGELKASARRGVNTVRGLISEWAPPSENDTGAYVAHVARVIGVAPDEAINVYSRLADLAQGITLHENGEQPYNPADIAVWVNS